MEAVAKLCSRASHVSMKLLTEWCQSNSNDAATATVKLAQQFRGMGSTVTEREEDIGRAQKIVCLSLSSGLINNGIKATLTVAKSSRLDTVASLKAACKKASVPILDETDELLGAWISMAPAQPGEL